jgi:hypothetical protein
MAGLIADHGGTDPSSDLPSALAGFEAIVVEDRRRVRRRETLNQRGSFMALHLKMMGGCEAGQGRPRWGP